MFIHENDRFKQEALNKPDLINSVILVTLCHVALFFVLNYLWSAPKIGLPSKVATPALKSYLITEQQLQEITAAQTSTTQGSEVMELDEKAQELDNNQRSTEVVESAAKERLKTKEENSAREVKQQVEEARLNTQVQLPQVNTTNSSGQTHNKQAILNATKAYMSNAYMREQAEFFEQQLSDNNNAVATMSDMTPNMTSIDIGELPPDIEEFATDDSLLDPNRIMQKGDYCYEVVDVSNQVNQHAWNYGFSRFCGEDKTKKAVNEAINNRLNNIGKMSR